MSQPRPWRNPARGLLRLFPDRDPTTTMALYALIRAGYRTRRSIARTPDDELLPIRSLGPKGLARIRAVIPHEGA